MKIVSKSVLIITFALLITLAFTSYADAQSRSRARARSGGGSDGVKSMSLGGATGLIATPTASTGWDPRTSVALDLGYHYIKDTGEGTSLKGNYSIPKALLHLGIAGTSLELGCAYDIQPEVPGVDKTNDILFNVKWVFMKGLAIGGNYQKLELNHKKGSSSDKQIYLAATYPGTFFADMPAETTIVIGHTFYGDDTRVKNQKKNLDFSMGFDLTLFPQTFRNHLHWINDFANYSYSTEAGGADALNRGCFNTGLRIAALANHSRFKFNIDILLTDALDTNRDWGVGASFGLAF